MSSELHNPDQASITSQSGVMVAIVVALLARAAVRLAQSHATSRSSACLWFTHDTVIAEYMHATPSECQQSSGPKPRRRERIAARVQRSILQ